MPEMALFWYENECADTTGGWVATSEYCYPTSATSVKRAPDITHNTNDVFIEQDYDRTGQSVQNVGAYITSDTIDTLYANATKVKILATFVAGTPQVGNSAACTLTSNESTSANDNDIVKFISANSESGIFEHQCSHAITANIKAAISVRSGEQRYSATKASVTMKAMWLE